MHFVHSDPDLDSDYESDESDSGESWGELEKKAAREDREAHNRVGD